MIYDTKQSLQEGNPTSLASVEISLQLRFGHQKRSFSQTRSKVDLFENALFMLSCGRVDVVLYFVQIAKYFCDLNTGRD